jgi:glucose/arabinose dehydrogenase
LARVGTFSSPTHVEDAPGERKLLFVVEQGGTVRVVKGGKTVSRPFLDISGRVQSGGERGLLSIAFPPDYQRTRRFYVYYTDNAGAIQIDQYRRSRGSRLRAGSSSRKGVIRIPHPGAANHNGGQLQLDGKGHLWIGTGDGGGGGDQFDNARKTSSLLGKLLRIRPKAGGGYAIPSSNPFVGQAGRDEIFSIGLRNPWRFSFDRGNERRLVIADVGQSSREEVNYVKLTRARGGNFGWPTFEGTRSFDPNRRGPGTPIPPIFDYSHGGGNCSITGGFIVRDRKLRSLYRRYVYADLCAGDIRSLVPRLGGARNDRPHGLSVSSPTSFGEGRKGKIYVASGAGPVFRLKPR